MFKSRRNPFNARNFSFERLESRQLMAADVSAHVANGTLYVAEGAGWIGGDNGVEVRQIAPNTMRVTGLQTDDGGLSKVNGHAYQDFSGVTSLTLSLGGGNDRVSVGRSDMLTTLNNVVINTDGTNVFNAYGFDYDHINVANLRTTGKLDIQTGIGDDYLDMGNLQIGNDDLDSVTLHTGAGSDTVLLGGAQVTGALSIFTADTNSKVTDSDHVYLQAVRSNLGIEVHEGGGKDTLDVNYVDSYGDILFDTGAGNDVVKLNSVRATDDFFTKLGDGDDVLDITFLRANRLTLDGGSGKDTLTTHQNGPVNFLSEVNWESIDGRTSTNFHPLGAPATKK